MEINLEGLPKAATKNVTEAITKHLEWCRCAGRERPESLHLYAEHYDKLEEALKSKNRKLEGSTYKGVLLRRAAS